MNVRREQCECFEERETKDRVLLKNNGEIISSDFDYERNKFFINYLNQIYQGITTFRNLDAMENA